MKKILVTGAAGLIGKETLKALLEQETNIFCLDRIKPPYKNENLKFIKADFSTSPKEIIKKLPAVDAVVHIAAHIGGDDPNNDFLLHQNVNMVFTEELFRYCREKNISKVIYISSLSFLQKPLLPIIDENHPLAPLGSYAVSKYWGEMALFRYAEKHFTALSLRLSSPLAHQYHDLQNTVVKQWIQKALAKNRIDVFGTGSRSQDFVSTKDVASGIIKALNAKNACGIYNIASGRMISMKDLAEIIATRFKQVRVEFLGNDSNENDRWNISINKARQELDYAPQFTVQKILSELLDSFYEDRRIK